MRNRESLKLNVGELGITLTDAYILLIMCGNKTKPVKIQAHKWFLDN